MTSSQRAGPHDGDDHARIEAHARDLAMGGGDDDAARADWRAADPRHEQAWRDASRAWSAIGRTRAATGQAWRREAAALQRAASLRRLAAPVLAAACLAAVVALPLLRTPPGLTYATRTAETRDVRLSDGSRVYIGARSTLQVRVGRDRREVRLDQGEAFFDVAHDPSRPFFVLAGDTRIRVVGTRFDVTRTGDHVRVSVLQGRVQVARRPLLPGLPPRGAEHVLTGGEQIRATGSQAAAAVTPIGMAEPGAWRAGRLLYADAPLGEVVADANRYSTHPIRLASADLGELRVTATFRTTAIDDLVSNLGQALPIRSQRQADGSVVLAADPAR